MNLYATGFPEMGFNLDELVIFTVKLVIGDASKYFDFRIGVCRTLNEEVSTGGVGNIA